MLLLLPAPWIVTEQIEELNAQVPSNALGDCRVVSNSTQSAPMILKCSVTPSDNAYVDNLIPSKAFGDLPTLIVQNIPSVPISKNYAFLKFDLSTNLPRDIVESSAKPANESLWMYVRLMNFFYNATVEIHAGMNESWSENNITWNNMPQFDPKNYVSANIRQNGTWARWNITHLPEATVSTGRNLTLVAISNETAWKNLVWFDSKEYPYANGTTTPTLNLTYVEPSLTIETPYPNLPVSIGSTVINTDNNGTAQTFVPWGKYEITVPNALSISNGTRAHFLRWGDNNTTDSSRLIAVGNNLILRANYGVQHLLNVYSSYGTTNGSGWYLDHTNATISVSPTSVPVEGPLAWLGERYVFDHWTGACSSNDPQCTVLIDTPKEAQAVWRTDWTITEVGLAAIASFAALLSLPRVKQVTHKKTKRSYRHRHRPKRRS
jgi:hypothetical protein